MAAIRPMPTRTLSIDRRRRWISVSPARVSATALGRSIVVTAISGSFRSLRTTLSACFERTDRADGRSGPKVLDHHVHTAVGAAGAPQGVQNAHGERVTDAGADGDRQREAHA